MSSKFMRRVWNRYSKLGKGRKKKQKWRKPKGRDNKMREKRRGYPVVVSIGYGTKKTERGKIENKIPMTVKNLNDLKKAQAEKASIIIAKVGMKKKIEIAKEAHKHGVKISNLNITKFLKEVEGKEKKQ